MIELPKTIEHLHALIRDRVAENINLDYKRSAAIAHDKRGEIAKDVSSFLNSDGGVIVYGVEEDPNDHMPVRVDEGVDHAQFSQEWLEHVITSNIQPSVSGIIVVPIPAASSDRSLYAVGIPKSQGVAYQNAVDKRYYKRFNFKSQPMEHYEIEDVRNRRRVVPGRLSVGIEADGQLMSFYVANESDVTLRDIAFQLPAELGPWLEKKTPNFFTRGIRELGPNRRMAIVWNSYLGLTQGESRDPKVFDIAATYVSPGSELPITDTFHIDLLDYWNTRIERTELEKHGEILKKALSEIGDELKKVRERTDELARIAQPTGLSLSVTTLRNLHHLISRQEGLAKKIDPSHCEMDVFCEVLGVEQDLAFRLWKHFGGRGPEELKQIEGVTTEVTDGLRRYFELTEGPDDYKSQT